MATTLMLNQSTPIQSLSGGSFAETQAGNSLMNLFGGSSGNPIHLKQMDPFSMRPTSRFEVPDTAQVVNLGDMVHFVAQTDTQEPFWTQVILPLVDYGWAVRVFSYGKWVFPQMKLRPSAETAPPRMLESYQMKAITQMEHFNIGQHMSKEYAKTERGKLNQMLNLKQIAISVQEGMNLRIQNELLRCNRRTREFLEETGSYRPRDVRKAILKEINRFCMLQKDDFGIETLTTELMEEVARNKGTATTWILTKRLNFYTLTKDHRTIYSVGGPDAVSTLRDPNRSIMPGGMPIYYTQTYPERFGVELGPWHKDVQIGGYAWAGEIPDLNSGEYDEKYLQAYTTKCLSVWIYDQEKDNIVEMKASEMLFYSNLFETDGSIKNLPSHSNDPNYINDVSEDFGIYDKSRVVRPAYHPYLGKINPASLEGPSLNKRNDTRQRSSRHKQITKGPLPNMEPLKHIGHMDQKHFSSIDYCSAGYQILLSLSKYMGLNISEITSQYNAGMALYKELCQRKVNLKTLDKTFEDVVKKNFLWKYEDKIDKKKTRETRTEFRYYNIFTGGINERTDVQAAIAAFSREIKPYAGTTSAQNKVSPPSDLNGSFRAAKAIFDINVRQPIDVIERKVSDVRSLPSIQTYISYAKNNTITHAAALNEWIAHKALEQYVKESKKEVKEFFYYTDGAVDKDAIWKDIVNSCTSDEYMNGLVELKDQIGRSILPLPDGTEQVSLAGYASFDGMKEMARLYNTREEGVIKHYNMDKLKIANDFVNLINKFSQTLFRLLPDCELFTEESIQSVHSRDKTKEAVVAEKMLGMVGIPVWMNLKHAQTFIMEKTRGEAVHNADPTPVNFLSGTTAPNTSRFKALLALFKAIYNRYMGEPLVEIIQKLTVLEEYEKTKSGPVSAAIVEIKDFSAKIVNPFTKLNGTDALTDIVAAIDATVLDDIKGDSSTFFQLNVRTSNANLDNDDDVTDELDLNRVYGAVFGSKKKYVYTRTVVEVVNAILSSTNIDSINTSLKTLKVNVFDAKRAVTLDQRISALIKFINDTFTQSSSKKSPSKKLPPQASQWLKDLNDNPDDGEILLITDMNLNLLGTDALNDAKITAALNDVAGNLKVNIPVNKGETSQAIIGSKATRQRARGRPSILTDKDKSSFYRTSLTFSVEQVEELLAISTQDKQWENIFDIRVSDPSNFRHYLSKHHFEAMKEAIKNANKSFEPESIPRYQNIRQLPDSLEEHDNLNSAQSPLISKGWSIPLLSQEKRGTRVFLGSKPEGKTMEDRQHNANDFGINIRDVTDNMRDLVYKITQECGRGIQMLAAIAYLVSPFKYNTLNSFLKNNIKLPLSFAIVRPHMNYITESGAYLAPGLQTLGFTSVAGLDYDAGSNVMNKEWNAHLTLWFAPVVMHPENCYIQDNLAILDFGTGGGTKYYTPEMYNSDMPGYRTFRENYPSVMVLPLPKNEILCDEIISVTGRIPQYSSKAIRHDNNSYDTSYSTSARANHTWNWNQAETDGFESTLGSNGIAPKKNVICARGSAWYWNPYKGSGGSLGFWCPNRGHMGPEEGPGCKRIRQGEIRKWPRFEYHKLYPYLSC